MPVHDIIDNRTERLVDQSLEDIRLSKKADQRRRAGETAENLQKAIALMDQPDEGESLVKTLVTMIEEKLHPHSFRHTFCINLARAAVPLHIIQELTGHKMLNTLRIYLRVTQRKTDETIAKLPSGIKTWKTGQVVFNICKSE